MFTLELFNELFKSPIFIPLCQVKFTLLTLILTLSTLFLSMTCPINSLFFNFSSTSCSKFLTAEAILSFLEKLFSGTSYDDESTSSINVGVFDFNVFDEDASNGCNELCLFTELTLDVRLLQFGDVALDPGNFLRSY